MDTPPRREQDILSELRVLCTAPGYIHAIAALCHRDNFLSHSGTIQVEQMLAQFSHEKLIRSEIATLIGLMLTGKVAFDVPQPSDMQAYLDRSDQLLRELHDAINAPLWKKIAEQISSGKRDEDLLSRGAFLREPIFYSSESAYNFQYREMAAARYGEDEGWLRLNKGFTAEQAAVLFRTLMPLQSERLVTNLQMLRFTPNDQWTVLPGFTFTSQELAERADVSSRVVELILNAFTSSVQERNSGFCELNDYNVATSLPLIRREEDGAYVLLQPYSLFESLYDSPFYWMLKDPSYAQAAAKHRGSFTERFCVDKLRSVFGAKNVYQNVMLHNDMHSTAGEIDVLVVFANRCIVLQAKSKRLTVPARKGKDGPLENDFKKGVQASYDQAFECATLLLAGTCKVLDSAGVPIDMTKVSHVYPLCVLSDHYPALSFQVKQFLKTRKHAEISEPFVLDVFTVDVLTEFLTSPLYLLSYIERRTRLNEVFSASHELVVLAYHLKYNLWSDGSHGLITLEDDICVELDMAMYARRDAAPAPETPDGVLTHFLGTPFHSLIKSIEQAQSIETVDLGFFLLELSGNAIGQINAGIEIMKRMCAQDGLTHDFTMGSGRSGITVHCSPEPVFRARETLHRHAMQRKYIAKADTWFGLCLSTSGATRFGVNLRSPWKYEDELAKATAAVQPLANNIKLVNGRFVKMKEPGRNDPCPCLSGRKYKKCCLS